MKYIILIMLIVAACDDQKSSRPETTVSEVAEAIETDSPTESPDIVVPANEMTMTEEFILLINNHRISLGLNPLLHVSGIADIVTNHSEDMANGTVAFGHDGFSTRCSDSKTVIGGGNLCGENVAKGQKSVKSAYDSWMSSDGHRKNIEQSRYTHTGFGFAQSDSGTHYWTQIFLEMK